MSEPIFKNLIEFADIIGSVDNSEDSELGFDMQHTYETANWSEHPCGTASCIGGWLQYLKPEYREKYLPESMKEEFGIPQDDAAEICFPERVPEAWEASPKQAEFLLKHYDETGTVDWELAMKQPKEG